MSETIVLDPNEEAPDRFEFDLTPYIGGAGPDFGEAAVEAFFADADLGQVPIAYHQLNRPIVIPLVLHGRTELTYDELRSLLQAKVGLWQRKGGVIKRETTIGPVYADIADARLKFGGSTAQAVQDVDVDAVLTLEVIPDWYGPEIDLSTTSGTGRVIRVLQPERGDHPGRVRIVVTDTENVARLGVLWAYRSEHYDSATTAALRYEAEGLTLMDTATVTTISGASGGGSNNVVTHAALGSNWTPVMLTDLDGVGPLTHQGSYRVFARCYTTSTTPPRVRLVWDVGDLTNPVVNEAVTLPGTSAFYLLDLGEIRLDAAPLGTHLWKGQVQGAGTSGGENISIDTLELQPLDEFAGALRASVIVEPGLQDYAARDEFNQAGTTLNGVTAPVGGNWATTGDTGDFNLDTSGHNLFRQIATDTGVLGRAATIGSVMTNTAVRADVMFPSGRAGSLAGVLLRYVDTSNFVAVALQANDLGPVYQLKCLRVVAGSLTERTVDFGISVATWYTVQAYADTDGNLMAWAFPRGGAKGTPLISFRDSALATGGALDDGKAGLYDFGQSVLGTAHDNFAAWVPDLDCVVDASGWLEIRTDGVYRENGSGSGAVSWASGDLPRLPAPGMESKAVELFVRPSRGDLDQLPDTSPDDAFDVQVLYRPSYLYVPNGGPGS